MIAEVLTPHIPRMLLFCVGCFHVSSAVGTLSFLGKIFMTFMLLLGSFSVSFKDFVFASKFQNFGPTLIFKLSYIIVDFVTLNIVLKS